MESRLDSHITSVAICFYLAVKQMRVFGDN